MMVAAWDCIGCDGFTKRYSESAFRHPINKALFEAWGVNLASLDLQQLDVLKERKTAQNGVYGNYELT